MCKVKKTVIWYFGYLETSNITNYRVCQPGVYVARLGVKIAWSFSLSKNNKKKGNLFAPDYRWHLLAPWKNSYDQPRQHIKKQRRYFDNKGPSSQSYVFSSSHVWMWDIKLSTEELMILTVVLEKTLESPLDCKEIQPIHPKGNQSWLLIGRTDAEAETPILWPPDAKNWLIWKDPDNRKD